ncbi:MAG: 7-cyano-7-deazaguanine synthase QueC [Myxococcales bacterium]|nr:7-cyano-7-deazaguanine synthase QueC [Myxococcales bacterium]
MREGSEKRAVVLLSGGLDSATVLAEAVATGRQVTALSFRYGQRHEHELQAAARVAAAFGVTDHVIATIDLGIFGGSALTDAGLAVPHGRSEADMGEGIPITYVPARNTIFLSFALALAEVRGAEEIHLGINAVDYSGYPDCRPEYLAAFQAMAALATRQGVEGAPVRLVAPLVLLSKADIVRRGVSLGVDYALTHSCYDPAPDGGACGDCDACVLRRRGFAEAGVDDPTRYAAR